MSCGQVMTGGASSTTVMLNEQAAVNPQASAAAKLIVVKPTGKASPEFSPLISVRVTCKPGQLSLAVGAGKVTTLLH